ncbi:MAG: thioredoxin family protein [Flavobacteriales bacterium]|nr:thioredoxin family protein [Flavobacteriales bacterium]MCX7649335.1 thioredoxin family protein [Flavobacteriales bacterium]MDW8431508.1 thioredoxin family protein [Flavobacteriales bacterium]
MLRLFFKVLIFVVTFHYSGFAQGSAVSGSASPYTFKFFEGTLDAGLKEAQKTKKMVFVDAYTTWCGPCKMMNHGPFRDADAGKFFNENFVNMKIDMERGEGPSVAMKYGVRAYPTLLFLNSSGEVVHKILGYHDAMMLVAEGRKALSMNKSK